MSGMLKKRYDIAVVGMAGIFPKAKDTSRFIENILASKSCISNVPENRWHSHPSQFISPVPAPDKALCDKAGLIDEFDYDLTGFRLDQDLLQQLDTLHKAVLHAGRDAFSQCSTTDLERKATGVILASIALPTRSTSNLCRQVLLGKDTNGLRPLDAARNGVVSWPAAILSRAMGFEAGSYTLDAACASSLVSIKLACEHLLLKKADIMIAGGVSFADSLYTQIGFSQLQALSPRGICAPFDSSADGLIVGEGAGIIVLKRLEDAIRSGDTIHAVITGAGLSNDIDGTLVGPASEGQVRAMVSAYRQTGWSPSDIQYMECHGSGTPVGDQVELSSIKSLLDICQCPEAAISIGSVKSMVGHLLTGAGAAGFIKAVLSMNRKVLPPSLNFKNPSEKSPIHTSNIKVQTTVEEWIPQNNRSTRKAAVSAFGFGGINAHLLLEEYPDSKKVFPVKSSMEPETDSIQPCAIVGMACITQNATSLNGFKEIVFGERAVSPPGSPDKRWKRVIDSWLKEERGFYLEQFEAELGRFHIPPNQMDDILTQHLFLLQAACESLEDAGIPARPGDGESPRERVGAAIGIDFDFGAADFDLRWQINALDEVIKSQISPALTFNRTLGALGGITASRVAREFKLGGPCFTLSSMETSGIKAVETAIHSLSSHETDIYICGCVDMAGDIRQTALRRAGRKTGVTHLPSEGAAAVVLKRYDQAIADGNKIYGIIEGVGSSGGDAIPGEPEYQHTASERIFTKALNHALENSGISDKDIDLIEYSEGAVPVSFVYETISKYRQQRGIKKHLAISSSSAHVGRTGAVSSMFSIIQAALSLYHGRVPEQAVEETGQPAKNKLAPERICVSSATSDGTVSHLIIKKGGALALTEPGKDRGTKKQEKKASGRITLKTNPIPLSENIISEIQSVFDPPGTTYAAPEIDPLLVSTSQQETARAHERFLSFSTENMQLMESQFETLAHLAGQIIQNPDSQIQTTPHPPVFTPPLFDRDKCMEFAVGKAGNVIGPEFNIIDTYPVRVRLPDDPLMLVDRIMDIEGEMLSLDKGKIITQHDVKPGAWYLDGPKTPVSISIEAGQADLFLCSWLGIDHQVKGKRKYRLLDAKVMFHRTLPEAGETIEYHIEIDRFLKQGEVYLFFFHYNGYIDGDPFISMRDGCAGFFNEEEVEKSGGIILKPEEKKKIETVSGFIPFPAVQREQINDDGIQALREGDLEKAFGAEFKGKKLGRNLKLPGGRMHLIDRVLDFDPEGGRYGLGSITAQSDIHPDAWFLTCHFIDDMVMPGTLMYECCAHALRVFTMRIGWISDRDDVYYDVLPMNEADLKCRGPVTQQTKHARYEIDIKEIGYNPEPYVIADANMFSDDLRIVLYKNMGMKLVGLNENELRELWRK